MPSTPPTTAPSSSPEQEKTRRTLIVAGAVTIIGLTATILFFRNIDDRAGTLKVHEGGIEVKLERPFNERLAVPSKQAVPFGDTVPMTIGTVADSALRRLHAVPPHEFVGPDLVDPALGVVLSSDHPARWRIDERADQRRMRLVDTAGATIEIRSHGVGRSDSVTATVRRQAADAGAALHSTADVASGTTLLWYTTNGQRHIVKVITTDSTVYTVHALAPSHAEAASIARTVSGVTPIAFSR